MKATKFTIDRSRWGCGPNDEPGNSLLSVANGKMCCLGFYALACGAKPEQIRGCGDYDDWTLEPEARELLPSELVKASPTADHSFTTPLHDKLIKTNDSKAKSRPDRERRIASLFASMGVAVEFTGEYTP